MSSNPPPYISHEKNPRFRPIPPSQSDILPEGWTDPGTKDALFKKVMQEDWDDVISTYNDKKGIVWTAKITRNKETALHIAISDSKTEVVKKLLDIIDPINIRDMMNDMGENPLHLAASLGQAETCKQLVAKDPELIGARNKEGETPLFQAALHGKEKAFYALHPKCPIIGEDIKHDIVHCKRTDGNSILHVAIQGEYFGLAYQIINWYPELIIFMNEKGQTALHFLAQNPSAFRSGCHLGPFYDFIYRCSIVDSDEVKPPSHFRDEHSLNFDQVPGNYQTCLDLLKLWKDIFIAIAPWARKWKDIKHDIRKIFNKDVEKQLPMISTGKDKKQAPPEERCVCSHINIKVGDEMKKKRPQKETKNGQKEEEIQEEERDSEKLQKKDDSTEQPRYPSNYNVFFIFLQLAMEFFLCVFGLGYIQVRKIKAEKQKHKLACQVMNKLILDSKSWEHEVRASGPVKLHSRVLDSLPTEPSDDASEHSTEEEKKRKEMMEPIRELNKLVQEIKSGIQGTEVFVEAEKIRPDVYGFKMPKHYEDGRTRSPLLAAAKMGVIEIVKEILDLYPLTIYDQDADGKNAWLLAVENRQPDIYHHILRRYPYHKSIYRKVDKGGNSAIHLAATLGQNKPWPIPGAALQLQCELRWYEVNSMMPLPRRSLRKRNLPNA